MENENEKQKQKTPSPKKQVTQRFKDEGVQKEVFSKAYPKDN